MILLFKCVCKIHFRYNLTGEDVKNQARFEDTIGIFPEFIDGYNILILPTSGRYFHVMLNLSLKYIFNNEIT